MLGVLRRSLFSIGYEAHWEVSLHCKFVKEHGTWLRDRSSRAYTGSVILLL